MSQEFLDVLGVDVAAEQQRGARVPEIVETDALGQSGALEEILEGAHDVAMREGRADGRREDETVILPREDRRMRSPSWRLRWALSAATLAALRSIRRRLRFVFGAVSLPPERARFTRKLPALKFTSSHFKPSSSPGRIPVCAAKM